MGTLPLCHQYGPTRGYAPLVDAIGELMRTRGIDTTTDERLVTWSLQ